MRGPIVVACAALVAAAVVVTPKSASALPAVPAVSYGEPGVVEQVKKRYNNDRYSKKWKRGHHYRPYAHGYRPYGYRSYGYRSYGYRPYGYYGYNRPYYGHYGYRRPGVSLWFGF